jgi:predicted enzyme related to lactoylglutathione lyase
MTMADQGIRGRFVWHELMTPDTAGAHSFYSKALGWKTQSWDQDPSYSMFVAGSGPLGGSVAEPNGAPNWLTYVGTTDVAATVEQARSLGGKVVKELTSMPNGGTYAVLTDPQGASFGVYASTTEPGPEGAPKRGEFSWHELATTDYRAAFDFYSALFGWERLQEHDMGPMGVYFIFGRNGVQKGGIFNKPAEMKGPPAWCGYVRVKDVNQIVNKVKSARGTLINGPMEVPGGDWIAQFLDPYGAMFAVHALAADVKAPAAAPREEAPASTAAAEPAAAKAAPKPAPKPAKKAAKAPAKKAAAKKPKKAAKKAAKAAKKAGKKAAKKAAARKKGGKKKASKKRSAAKSAKRPARKAARGAKRGKKKAARKK